jgi:hypothetical protein
MAGCCVWLRTYQATSHNPSGTIAQRQHAIDRNGTSYSEENTYCKQRNKEMMFARLILRARSFSNGVPTDVSFLGLQWSQKPEAVHLVSNVVIWQLFPDSERVVSFEHSVSQRFDCTFSLLVPFRSLLSLNAGNLFLQEQSENKECPLDLAWAQSN